MDKIEVSISEASQRSIGILSAYGTPGEIAERITDLLIDNDILGYHSHGLMRLGEYLAAIKAGKIIPANLPSVRKVSTQVFSVSGEGGFGILAAQSIAEAMTHSLSTNSVSIVGLTNCNHIGRLFPIGHSVSRRGHILMGFCNYNGGGQRVGAWGGSQACLATNPILFSAPYGNDNAMVIDMSSSVVAEGVIRNKLRGGEEVPEGWLYNENWQPVKNPETLYSSPPGSFIAPLGGDTAGYKGFLLGIMTEILAGIVNNADFAKAGNKNSGNSGFFVGFRSGVLGKEPKVIEHEILQLLDFCTSGKFLSESKRFRVPGNEASGKIAVARKEGRCMFDAVTWSELEKL